MGTKHSDLQISLISVVLVKSSYEALPAFDPGKPGKLRVQFNLRIDGEKDVLESGAEVVGQVDLEVTGLHRVDSSPMFTASSVYTGKFKIVGDDPLDLSDIQPRHRVMLFTKRIYPIAREHIIGLFSSAGVRSSDLPWDLTPEILEEVQDGTDAQPDAKPKKRATNKGKKPKA